MRTIKIGDYNFETVQNFSYLGSKITTDNSYAEKIRRKIANSWLRSREESSEEFLAPYMRMDDSVAYMTTKSMDDTITVRLWKKSGSIGYAGHLIRMDEDDPIRKVYKGNIHGKKKSSSLLRQA